MIQRIINFDLKEKIATYLATGHLSRIIGSESPLCLISLLYRLEIVFRNNFIYFINVMCWKHNTRIAMMIIQF